MTAPIRWLLVALAVAMFGNLATAQNLTDLRDLPTESRSTAGSERFPIGIWKQDPTATHDTRTVAAHYAEMGMTHWVGLHAHPDALPAQLTLLKQHGFAISSNYLEPSGAGAALWTLPLVVRNTRRWLDAAGYESTPNWGFVECGNSTGRLDRLYPVMPWRLIGAAAWLQVIAGADGITYVPQHRLTKPTDGILPSTDKYPIVEPACRAVLTTANQLLHRYAGVLKTDRVAVHIETTGPVPVLHTAHDVDGVRFLFVIGNGDALHPDGVEASIRFPASSLVLSLLDGKKFVPGLDGYVSAVIGPYMLGIYSMPAR